MGPMSTADDTSPDQPVRPTDADDAALDPVHEPDLEENDGSDLGFEPGAESGYAGRGQAGDEVVDILETSLAEEYGSDDPGESHLSDRMRRERGSQDDVARFSEDGDAVLAGGNDQFGDEAGDEVDEDRHDLSAEESAMHYVDEDDDSIPL